MTKLATETIELAPTAAPDRPVPTLAFVVPCYNEEQVLPELVHRLSDLSQKLQNDGQIRQPATLVLVDDGSSDKTWPMIEEAAHSQNVTGVKLSRNHGHQAALLAGLMSAKADILISLDADLQDDLDAIAQMIEAYMRGAEIVFGVRSSRSTDTRFKRNTARAYYNLLRSMGVDIIPDHADFRLMSSRAIDTLREYREVNLFLRGLVKNIGYPSEIVEYSRAERFAGKTKYPLAKMLALAVEGITSFSVKPLRYVTWIGFSIALLSFGYVCYAIIARLAGITVSGWASIVVPIYMLGGIQLIALGIIGEYLGKLYLEAKRRPQFIVEKLVSSDDD